MAGIYGVKEGKVALGTQLLERAAESMKNRGTEKILLGYTEIPLALQSRLESRDSAYLDATTALAEACVTWWQSTKTARAPLAVSKG